MKKRIISTIIALAMMLSMLPQLALAATIPMTESEILRYFGQVENDIFTKTGSNAGYAKDPNSSTLAWAASYMMESYIMMYRLTGNEEYLKKLGFQIETAFNNLRDDLGNGSYGWDCVNYSKEKVSNVEFNTTAAWTRLSGTSTTQAMIDATGYSGNGLHIKTDGNGYYGMQTEITGYSVGKVYSLRLYGKVDGNATGRYYLKNLTTGEVIPTIEGNTYTTFEDIRWRNQETRYIIPESANQLAICLEGGDLSGNVYYDTVKFARANQYLVHESLIMAPAMKLIQMVTEDPALAAVKFDSSRTMKQLADKFLPIVCDNVAKWESCWRDVGSDMGVYTWPLNDEGSEFAGNALPHNQYSKMISVLLPLYDLTGNDEYLDHAKRMLTFLKSKMRLVSQNGQELYYWTYYSSTGSDPIKQSENTEDISHGALDVEAAIVGYEYGLIFNETDMKRITNTFLKTLWNGSTTDPEMYSNIVYNPSAQGYHRPMTSEMNIREWTRLARWEPSIADGVSAFFNQNSGKQGVGHPAKLLTYACLYEAKSTPVTGLTLEKTAGSISQTAGAEEQVSFRAEPNSSRYTGVSWTVSKNGSLFATGRGKTFSFKPSGVGSYVVTAKADKQVKTSSVTVVQATEARISIQKTSGEENQVVNNESPLSYTAVCPAEVSGTISWTVEKDGSAFTNGTGDTFTFTPSGRGTYTVRANCGAEKSNECKVVVATLSISVKSGSTSQIAGSERAVELQAMTSPSLPDSALSGISWSATKDGTAFGSAGTGKTFRITPSGAATYLVRAQLGKASAQLTIVVSSSGGSGGGSGGGGSGGGGGSFGGGGGGSSATTQPEKKTITTTYDSQSKTQTSTVDGDYFDTLMKNGSATITTPEKDGASSYEVRIPVKNMKTNVNKTVQINTPYLNVAINTDVAWEKSTADTSVFCIRVSQRNDDITVSTEVDAAPITVKGAVVTVSPEIYDGQREGQILLETAGPDWQICKNAYYQKGAISAEVVLPSVLRTRYAENKFKDLTAVLWAEAEIEALAARGIIGGTSPDTFDPNAKITRADYVALLIRTLGLSVEPEQAGFLDVSENDYFYKEVLIAQQFGLIGGDAQGNFSPRANITRQDMMVMTARALEATGTTLESGSLEAFGDAEKVADYARDAVGKLIKTGIVAGSHGNILPYGDTTRAEAAMILHRILLRAQA